MKIADNILKHHLQNVLFVSKDTMSYRITQSEVETLTETIITTLHAVVLN